MVANAKEEGFSSKSVSDLRTMGERTMINGYIDIAKDLAVEKAAGPSMFAALRDIVDAPQTLSRMTGGNTINQNVDAVSGFVKYMINAATTTATDIKSKTLNGIQAIQRGFIEDYKNDVQSIFDGICLCFTFLYGL
jgi:hypothetical protein